MPDTFSWTLAFKSSYFRNTFEKVFVAWLIIRNRAAASTRIATRKIMLSFTLMNMHITMLLMNIKGARTAIRMHIW